MNVFRFFAPGRINLIGEHLDYNGGDVLPAAISLGITLEVKPAANKYLILQSEGYQPVTLNPAEISRYNPMWGWANYPAGVIHYFHQQGFKFNGYTLTYHSTLPAGSGLSSSAALELVTAIAINRLTACQRFDNLTLAKICQQVEQQFIGVNCGIMDQFAIAMGKAGHAILLNCQSLDYRYIPFKTGNYSLAVIDTQRRRDLVDSIYNARRQVCTSVLNYLKQFRRLDALARADIRDIELLKDPEWRKRARHVITEQQRVLQAVESLENNDLDRFGRLMYASHCSLRDDYEVSCEELDFIVSFSEKFSGCLGARMTGAGFGGCAIALVKSQTLEAYQSQLALAFESRFQRKPGFYVVNIADGAGAL